MLLLVWNSTWKLKLGYESTRKGNFMKLDSENAAIRKKIAYHNGKGCSCYSKRDKEFFKLPFISINVTLHLSQGIENCVIDWLIFPFYLEPSINIYITKFHGVKITETSKLWRLFVKFILTYTGLFMLFFAW